MRVSAATRRPQRLKLFFTSGKAGLKPRLAEAFQKSEFKPGESLRGCGASARLIESIICAGEIG